ncbi:cyclin-like protein [Violaceomyces palustris]|uniref:Cyclin-like protein n=1 Tax=Violaceomyces palustris TaxID=1673888 RepID=A0ACD0P8H4_9BASI|nr:cyclin-like protein [Violaceomyces palustris]
MSQVDRSPPPSPSASRMRVPQIPSNPTTPPDYGPSLAYAQSSQARNWRFSAKQLKRMRDEGNKAARERLIKIWSEEKSGESSGSELSIPFLSVSDELALLTFYLVKIGQIVRAFGLPELVEATAMTFMKRFYLRNTCMDFHPKSIMLTCVFLATKAENYPLSLTGFATKLAGKNPQPETIRENEKTVLDLEFLVSQSLGFQYGVHGAHRSLYGLILDAQALQPPPAREVLQTMVAASHSNLNNSRLTDAEFIYTPSQIALACLRAADVNGRLIVGRWLDEKETLARSAMREAKAEREALREEERQRQKRVRVEAARKVRGRAGAKAAEEEEKKQQEAQQALKVAEFEDQVTDAAPLGSTRKEIESTLDEIEALFRAREKGGSTGVGKGAADLEKVKEIDKRLKECMNPEKVPGTRLYLKRQADEEAAAANKRAKRSSGKSEDGGMEGGDTVSVGRTGEGEESDDDQVPVSKDLAVKAEH